MNFTAPLIPGRLIKRYKRFLADVQLQDGQVVTAHCPNTGAMTGCAEADFQVWLSQSDNPKRKLAYTWELAMNTQGHWIGINTHNANKLAVEAIKAGRIAELDQYPTLRTEVKYGEESSRIDVLLESDDKARCYVEVKSVTLLQDDQGYFPDAKTARGTKHLRELAQVVREGHRAVLLFCVQHTGINKVSAASHIDPDYTSALQDALKSGVEVLTYGCEINQEKIELNQALSFNLLKKS